MRKDQRKNKSIELGNGSEKTSLCENVLDPGLSKYQVKLLNAEMQLMIIQSHRDLHIERFLPFHLSRNMETNT